MSKVAAKILSGLTALTDEVKPYDFSEQRCPGYNALSERQKKAFAFGHAVKHLATEIGHLADVSAKMDHGETDAKRTEDAIGGMLFAILKSMEALQVNPNKIADSMYRLGVFEAINNRPQSPNRPAE